MRAAFAIMCFTTVIFSRCWAENPYSDLKISIFNRDDEIQTTFFEAVKEIEQKFDEKFQNAHIRNKHNELAAATSSIPLVGTIFGALAKAVGTVLEDPDWKAEIQEMMKHEREVGNAINEVENMLKQFNTAIQWMQISDKTQDDYNTQVILIHRDLQEMINKFSDFGSVSHQKLFPLVGSQLLIALSLAVAAFEPIAADVMPFKAKQFTLPCQAYDLLLDYRAYAVDVRLNKLKHIASQDLSDVKLARYNPRVNVPPECKSAGPNFAVDPFSTTSNYMNFNDHCLIGYAKHLRHQIERMFPVQQLREACDKEWPERETSGMGYLTIRLIKVTAAELENHKNCDNLFDSDCDSYVKLYINGKKVLQTEPRFNQLKNEINRVFTSKEIPRDSTIKIEVLDDDGSTFQTIMVVEDDIDGFLEKPVRVSPHSRKTFASSVPGVPTVYVRNELVTAVFWKDTYNYLNCSEVRIDYRSDEDGNDVEIFIPERNCTESMLYQRNDYFKQLMKMAHAQW